MAEQSEAMAVERCGAERPPSAGVTRWMTPPLRRRCSGLLRHPDAEKRATF